MDILRDFLYLDNVKLYSFVSQLHGGLVSEINETIKKLGGVSGGIGAGIPPLGAKLDVSKVSETEQQKTVQLTDPAYFNVLYQYLQHESIIKNVTATDLDVRKQLSEGDFVEMQGMAKPPVVEDWIARVKSLVGFFDNNIRLLTQITSGSKDRGSMSQQSIKRQMTLFKEIVKFLEDYIRVSRKDAGKQYIRVINEFQSYGCWCGLLPNFTLIPLQSTLPAEVYVVGRVERILGENEAYKIVDFSTFNQVGKVNAMLDAINALGPLIGQEEQIAEADLQAQYPDIFVTPIAIYR